jgi:hypothetical protein
MVRQSYPVFAAALILGVVACESSTGPATRLSQADVNQLAADMDAVSTLGVTDFGPAASFSLGVDPSASSAAVSAVPTTFTTGFDVTRQCPKGGDAQILGSITGTGDRATHSVTLDASGTRADHACAFQTRDGVLTLTGKPNIAFTSHLSIVNGLPKGLQTATHKGNFTWARGGLSEDCAVDITSQWDPATHAATVSGKFCGMDVNVSRTRGS